MTQHLCTFSYVKFNGGCTYQYKMFRGISGVASIEQMEQLSPGLPRPTFVIRADPMRFLAWWV